MPRLMPIKLTEEWLQTNSLDLKPGGMRAYSVILFLGAMIIALSITLLKSQKVIVNGKRIYTTGQITTN